VIKKLKAFRPTIPSALLFLLASYRTLTSGDSHLPGPEAHAADDPRPGTDQFMMMAAAFLKATNLNNIPVLALGIAALVMMLTFGMIFAGYREQKK
jgi:hypothetical protein